MKKDNVERYRAMALREVANECRRSFFYFLKTFWNVIIAEQPVYNWHIPYLCSELQQLSISIVKRQKKPYDLIINIPPGTTKSTITTIMFPAWLWTQDPTIRIITNSYSADLSIEHAVKSRDIILSDKYRSLFPEIVLRRDKAAKSSYENTVTGARYTTSTGGTIMGKHAHLIINDDPLNPMQAASEADRKMANMHTETLTSRKINKANTPTIIIMQRLHEMDVTGHVLSKEGKRVKHLCLPAELSDKVSPSELRERYLDGLLDPIRLSREILNEQKIDLGSRGYSGQYEQNPVADGGNIIKREWFRYISSANFAGQCHRSPVVFFVDTAYTDKTENDPTGIIATCKIGNDLYITHARKWNLKFPDLIKALPAYVQANGYSAASSVRIEPKANGLSVIDQLKVDTKLNVTKTPTPTDSKETRLNAASPIVECGRVILVAGVWNDEFVGEVCGFPAKVHDEYVDLLGYAIDYHLKGLKHADLSRLAKLAH
jgi:predicted phage terminase large subunit-like protein